MTKVFCKTALVTTTLWISVLIIPCHSRTYWFSIYLIDSTGCIHNAAIINLKTGGSKGASIMYCYVSNHTLKILLGVVYSWKNFHSKSYISFSQSGTWILLAMGTWTLIKTCVFQDSKFFSENAKKFLRLK